MKKNKLSLNRNTLRILSDANLNRVVGGKQKTSLPGGGSGGGGGGGTAGSFMCTFGNCTQSDPCAPYPV